MNARPLHSLRTSVLLPVLSLVMAVTLVTGQVLKCCRLNEALSATAAQVFHAVTLLGGSHHHPAEGHAESASHPRCHSHEASAAQAGPADAGAPMSAVGLAWLPEDPCLSDIAFAPKGLPSSSPDPVTSVPASVSSRLGPEIPHVVRVERPRPQNRSSPPVYLLTLRLLV